ncbi:hypothetical protein NDU88_007814 [Pleurodeles waltl]|uniref:Uncharacterized protein n=1 Tax=Pleurodeles waltl TaxID=8319 RepID=A0AAV7RSZ3_PLEWA|nr:hypothetical protein NDU88_007814 [Pleurodeles waltl]
MARELKVLKYENAEISIYLDFTQQAKEAKGLFLPAKRKLRELYIEFSMLYAARLQIQGNSKSLIFSDPKLLQQFFKKRTAGEARCCSPGKETVGHDMSDVEE